MPKKDFTSKPIRASKKDKAKPELGVEAEVASEDFEDFYEKNGGPTIEKPKVAPQMWGIIVLVSILFGFGSAVAYNFFFDNTYSVSGNQNVVIDKNEDVTVTSEERLAEIAESLNPVVVNFYDNSSDVDGPFYQDLYSFGNGFVLTDNGWIVTTRGVFDKIGEKDYIVLSSDYKSYTVEKVLNDPISDIVFVKVDGKDMPVAKMGDISKSNSGQKVYGFISSFPEAKVASLHLADLKASNLKDVVASTEEFSHFVSAREGYDPSLLGSPIVNLTGEIIAIVSDTGFAIPTEYLRTAITDLGKKDKIDRAYFGVHYINLSKYPRVDLKTGEMRDKGAQLSGYNNMLAVEKGSPASKAGLAVGDIITAIEDEQVNGKKTLTAIIQEYDGGDEISVTVIRDGKEKAFDVMLQKFD